MAALVVLVLAAVAVVQLAGSEPDTGRLAFTSISISLLVIVRGVERGLAMPDDWAPRLSQRSARWAPPLAAAAAIFGAQVLFGTDSAVLIGLVPVVLVPVGRRAGSRS